MAMPEVHTLGSVPLTCHAFNADRSQVAVSLSSEQAQVYARSGGDWVAQENLAEHDKLITSIDWAPNTNRIVTCAQDRNAYVWQQTQDAQTGIVIWKPTLVLLRLNRAATCVRWSPLEDKFAVGSGARAVAVCYFNEDDDWWVSRHLKKPIRSTVLSVDWHPNNVLLACGSADNKARVLSAYIKDVDKKPAATIWGEKLPFNTVCGEYASPSGGWVHAVAFSPSGDVLAFASHDSSITIAYPAGPAIFTVKTPTLPYVTLTWTSEDSIVAAGHDCQPVLFSGTPTSDGWRYVGSLDDSTSSGGTASKLPASPATPRGGASGIGRLNNEAFNRFKMADSRGASSSASQGSPTSPGGAGSAGGESELMTVHQNTITSVRPYEYDGNGGVSRVSTTGVDGKLVIWSVAGVTAAKAR